MRSIPENMRAIFQGLDRNGRLRKRCLQKMRSIPENTGAIFQGLDRNDRLKKRLFTKNCLFTTSQPVKLSTHVPFCPSFLKDTTGRVFATMNVAQRPSTLNKRDAKNDGYDEHTSNYVHFFATARMCTMMTQT